MFPIDRHPISIFPIHMRAKSREFSTHTNRPPASRTLPSKRRQWQNEPTGWSMGVTIHPSIPLTKIKFATICLTERKLCAPPSVGRLICAPGIVLHI